VTLPLNQNFNALGYNDLYFIHNIGSVFLLFVLAPIMAALVAGMTACTKVSCITKLRTSFKKLIFWNSTVKTVSETYAVLVMCVLLNVL